MLKSFAFQCNVAEGRRSAFRVHVHVLGMSLSERRFVNEGYIKASLCSYNLTRWFGYIVWTELLRNSQKLFEEWKYGSKYFAIDASVCRNSEGFESRMHFGMFQNMKYIDMVDWLLSTGRSFSHLKSCLTGKRILIYHVVVFQWISKNARNPSFWLLLFISVFFVVCIILSRLFVYMSGELSTSKTNFCLFERFRFVQQLRFFSRLSFVYQPTVTRGSSRRC